MQDNAVTLQALILRYTLFASLATLANLLVQRIILAAGSDVIYFTAAVGSGTFVGLIIKYILDKIWIFHDTSTGITDNGRTFFLYTLMGLATTSIFWCVETLFWLSFQTDFMREVGAIIGLCIGYLIKYKLDREFVFTNDTLK